MSDLDELTAARVLALMPWPDSAKFFAQATGARVVQDGETILMTIRPPVKIPKGGRTAAQARAATDARIKQRQAQDEQERLKVKIHDDLKVQENIKAAIKKFENAVQKAADEGLYIADFLGDHTYEINAVKTHAVSLGFQVSMMSTAGKLPGVRISW